MTTDEKNIFGNFKNYHDKKDIDLTDNSMLQAILESLPEEMQPIVAEKVKEKLKKIVK